MPVTRPFFAESLAIATALLVAAAVVRAEPSKDVCATAFEETQVLRAEARLIDARKQALVCAAESCPVLLSAPCLEWLDEIEAAIPSVVVAVVDAEGRDRPAEVTIDGRLVSEAASGQPVALDPGPHRFEVTVEGQKVAAEVVLRAGEQLRRVTLRPPGRRGAEHTNDGAGTGDAATTGGWVALSLGGAGLIAGAIGGGLALAEKASLDEACPTKTSCPVERQGDIDTMMTLSHVSTAGFVVGAVGVAVGTLLLVVAGGDDGGEIRAAAPVGFDVRSLTFIF